LAAGFSVGTFLSASPVRVSMAYHTMVSEVPTADERSGEGALGDGAGSHPPGRGDGRTLQKHGAINWGRVERVGVGVGFGGELTLSDDPKLSQGLASA
jgi:hypothetical protein